MHWSVCSNIVFSMFRHRSYSALTWRTSILHYTCTHTPPPIVSTADCRVWIDLLTLLTISSVNLHKFLISCMSFWSRVTRVHWHSIQSHFVPWFVQRTQHTFPQLLTIKRKSCVKYNGYCVNKFNKYVYLSARMAHEPRHLEIFDVPSSFCHCRWHPHTHTGRIDGICRYAKERTSEPKKIFIYI